MVVSGERADRVEDRINRAISQFADGIGRIDALRVLLRNNVDIQALKAPEGFLPSADLRGVDLRDAELTNAFLAEADLSKANLSKAKLVDITADDAYFLSNSTLCQVGFIANLSNTNLAGANLSGIDFRAFRRMRAAILGVATFCRTRMPDETRCDRDCDPSGACPWFDD